MCGETSLMGISDDFQNKQTFKYICPVNLTCILCGTDVGYSSGSGSGGSGSGSGSGSS